MYILLTTIISWLLNVPQTEHIKPLCQAAQIKQFAKQLDQHHWYFNRYLSKKKFIMLKNNMQQMECEPGIQFMKTKPTEFKQLKVLILGINR